MAVKPRIMAIVTLLVRRDIGTPFVEVSPDSSQAGCGVRRIRMAAPDSEQHIAGMKAPTTAFRPDSAAADHNRHVLECAR